MTCFCTVRRDKNIHVIFFLRTGCWPSGGLMNAGKNLCFANSLLQCLRITDIHKILEHHNCIGLLLNE